VTDAAGSRKKELMKNMDLDQKVEQIVDHLDNGVFSEEDFDSSPHVVSSNMSNSSEKAKFSNSDLIM